MKKMKKPIESEYNLGDIHAGYFREDVEKYERKIEIIKTNKMNIKEELRKMYPAFKWLFGAVLVIMVGALIGHYLLGWW